jgi:hypothetical protein
MYKLGKITNEQSIHQDLFDELTLWYNDMINEEPPLAITSDLIIN